MAYSWCAKHLIFSLSRDNYMYLQEAVIYPFRKDSVIGLVCRSQESKKIPAILALYWTKAGVIIK